MSTAFWIFGGLLIVLAVIFLVFAAVGMTRRTNVRRETDEVAGRRNIQRDPTINKRGEDVEDSVGNFTRTTPNEQGSNRNSTGDRR